MPNKPSRATLVLSAIQGRAPEPVSLAEVVKEVGLDPQDPLDRQKVASAIGVALSNASRLSPWRHVHSVDRGWYRFDLEQTNPAAGRTADDVTAARTTTRWKRVGMLGATPVLQGPDGRRYAAVPLEEFDLRAAGASPGPAEIV
jgi:hypothetical protein